MGGQRAEFVLALFRHKGERGGIFEEKKPVAYRSLRLVLACMPR